ncbi:MAG: type 4a pilus biogenesis protein PilO [candidate division WOR-3 bacterium]|nr:type 4a pilus biogenesis protein PilO [candidate division WOR-3 bacterium]
MDKTLLRNIIITAVIVIAVGFLYWKFDYSKNAKRISELQKEYDKVNTQVAEARKVASRMDEYIQKLKVLEAQLKVADKMLPDSQYFEEVIDTITLLAERNNVKIKKMSPKPVSRGSESSSMGFGMEVLGKFSTIGLYLTSLGNQSRIFKTQDIEISPISSTPEGDYTVSAKFSITTYFKGTSNGENSQQGGKK